MKKTVFFVSMIIFGLLAICMLGFFMFGYFEIGGICRFKGPLSSVQGGACAGVQGNSYSGRYSDDLSLTIPANFFVNEEVEENEESEITFIFSKDPETVEEGEFAPNLNIIRSKDYIEFSDSVCEELIDASIEQLTPYYESIDNGGAAMEDINGVGACVTQWEGKLSGLELFQKQFAVPHEESQVVYYFTITTDRELSELDVLNSIVASLKLI